MARYTVWTNTPGNDNQFFIIGTFPGANEAEALDSAARDAGELGRQTEKGWEGYASYEERNKALNFTRENYRVKKVEE